MGKIYKTIKCPQARKLITELVNIHENFKKGPKRVYKRSTLQNKLAKARKIFNRLLQLVEINSSQNEQKLVIAEARSLFGFIKSIVENKLQTAKNPISFKFSLER